MIDCVATLHTNPYTCGVAKFNQRLARELGVPCVPLRDATDRYRMAPVLATYRHPLLSIKWAELTAAHFELKPPLSYDLFLHDAPRYRPQEAVITKATRVFAANPVIARAVSALRRDVIEAWCPSLVEPTTPRADLTVLTFGMAHKYIDTGGMRFGLPDSERIFPLARHYEKLRDLLDAHGQPYTILLSTAVHEGTPWDEALQESETEMRRIFGDHLIVLGFLSDWALARELENCSAVAVFYEPALRANNTTFWAALEAGALVISNRDADSPAIGGWYDIGALQQLPGDYRWALRQNAVLYQHAFGWDRLTAHVQERVCAS